MGHYYIRLVGGYWSRRNPDLCDLIIVPQDTLNIAKKFFKDRGIEVAGGITLTISTLILVVLMLTSYLFYYKLCLAIAFFRLFNF